MTYKQKEIFCLGRPRYTDALPGSKQEMHTDHYLILTLFNIYLYRYSSPSPEKILSC